MQKKILTSGLPAFLWLLSWLFFACTWVDGCAVSHSQNRPAIKDSSPAGTTGARKSVNAGGNGKAPAGKIPKPHFSYDREALGAHTEIVTIGSSAVTWPEFYFWLRFIEKHYRKVHRIDAITDWSVQQNGMPLKAFFLSSAVGYACKERAIEAKALELGVGLSADDRRKIEQTREKNIKIYGRSEYLRMIMRMYVSEEVFAYLTRMDRLGMRLFAHLYGENGETCPEKNVSACQRRFRSQVEDWCAELDIVYKAAYHKIDPESIFR
jgi:hypothetical protein